MRSSNRHEFWFLLLDLVLRARFGRHGFELYFRQKIEIFLEIGVECFEAISECEFEGMVFGDLQIEGFDGFLEVLVSNSSHRRFYYMVSKNNLVKKNLYSQDW